MILARLGHCVPRRGNYLCGEQRVVGEIFSKAKAQSTAESPPPRIVFLTSILLDVGNVVVDIFIAFNAF